MANVKVAIRVRPLNARENKDGGRVAVQVEDKVVRVRNMKLEGRLDGPGDSRERWMEFGFDYCYWSVDPDAPHYASQEEVFQDLGVSVLAGASEGYNVCLFAYGQTGSGKTYTMIGTPASIGLTPRICQGLFRTEDQSSEGQSSSRVEISFLEIYNERVRDLLRRSEEKKPPPLRVREHPEKGPYVQGLSQHVVSEYKQAVDLLEEGISKRITAATHIHDTSSRSHAIFSIQYTQAILENNRPSEIVSKINLVDLAGSERADPNYCRDRITEGSNINKSLVTLGIVISALAQNSQMFSSCQSINSEPSEEGGSTAGSQSSSLSGGGRRHCFIPYRDSVLTWLLKDSLGGNSRTIMIATVSPSSSSYNETLSTLRYAAHARNIVNKPRINEDANVRLIRELREEIDRLKSMLLSYEMQRNPSPSLSEERDGSISELVLQNELKVEQLTKDWSDCWQDQRKVLEQYSVDVNRDRTGFLIHSHLPHLIALDRDVLSTGVTFYTLKEGVTMIGPHDQSQIVLRGESSCEIVNQQGTVTLRPIPGSVCSVNEREVTEPCRLAQGAVITLGGVNKFRFNHPAEAAILRERRRESEGTIDCYSADLSPMASNARPEGDGCWEQGEGRGAQAHPPRQRLEEQQRYIATLKEEIRAEQQRAEKDLESEQAHLRQQQREIQQWILLEKRRLAATEEQGKEELGVQTDPVSSPHSEEMVSANKVVGGTPAAPTLSVTVGDRKKVVQEELLRHHALRRAENRVRRKRLNYQLAKIAQKRHLLEAKRELQRLENALPPGQDSPTSTDLGYLSKTRGPPYDIRRHSFSADILSRLYPQHAPSFCHFLRRNKSSDFSSAFWRSQGPRKWVSEECLPSKRTRSRSNTMPSESSRSKVQLTSFPARLNNSMTHVPVLINRPERRCPLQIKNHKQDDSQADLGSPEQCRKSTNKSYSMSVTPSRSNAPKSVKSPSQGNKSLERIRKAFSHSVGPGIRTALSRVFRKPPSGFKRKSSKSPNKTTKRSQDRSEERETKVTDGQSRKVTLSCEDLCRSTASEEMKQKRWNSADVLVKVSETPASRQWKLAGCIENKQEDQGDGSSDCDSSFSVDSLSSAYATALAEQLKQEDSDLSEYDDKSEAGSVDSQMSQDSLVMESSKKNTTVRPLSKSAEVYHHPVMTHHCQSMVFNWQSAGEGIEKCSSLDSCSYDEMPAEAYWKLHGVSLSKVSHKPEVVNEVAEEPKWAVMSGDLQETQLREEPASGPLATDNTVRPFSASSSREPESLLVSTDAWSSTETTDSPRTDRVSTSAIRRVLHDSAECNSSTQSSEVLSDSLRSSESQIWSTSDCTEGENTTVELQKYWGTGTSTCSSMFQKTLEEVNMRSSADTIVDPVPEPLLGDVCNSEGCPIILSDKENKGGANAAMGTSDCPERFGGSRTESIPSGNNLEKAVPATTSKSCPAPTTVLKNLKPDNELETSHCNDKLAIVSIPKELQLGLCIADLTMENKTSGDAAEHTPKYDKSSEGSVRGENIPVGLTLAVNFPKFDTDTLSGLDNESKLSSSSLSDPRSNINEGSVMLNLLVQCCEIVQKSSPEESAVDFTPHDDCPDANNTSESLAQSEEGNIADVSKPWQHVNYPDRNEMQYDIEAEGLNLSNTDSLITSGVCRTDHFVLENEQNVYACTTTSHSQTDPVEGHQVKALDPLFSCIPGSKLRIGENTLSSGYSRSTGHNANEQNAAITAEEGVEREEKRGSLFLPKPTTGHKPSNDVDEAKVFPISKSEVEVNKAMDIECSDHRSCEMDWDESEGDQGEDEGERRDYEPGEVRDCLEEIVHKQCKPEKMAVLLKKGVIPRVMAPTYEASCLLNGSRLQIKEKSRIHGGEEILHRNPKKICMEAGDNSVNSAANNMGKLGSDLQGDFSREEIASPALDLSNYSPVHYYKDNSKQIENDFGFATSENDILMSEIFGETSSFIAKNEGLETHHEHHVRERSPIDQEIFEVVQKHMKTSSKESQDDSSGGENESSLFISNVPCKQGSFEESNPCALLSTIAPCDEGNPSRLPENSNGSEVNNLRDHLQSAEVLSFENSVPSVFLPFTEIKFHQDDSARVSIPCSYPEQSDPNSVALTSRTVAMSSPKTMESDPQEKQRTSNFKGHDFRLKDLNMQSYDGMNYVQIGSTGKICSIACELATKEQCCAQRKPPTSLELNDSRQPQLNKSKVASIHDCASVTDTQNHLSLAANPIPAEVVAEERTLENDANKNPMAMNTSGNKTEGSGNVVQSSSFRRDLTDFSGNDQKLNINKKQAVEQANQQSRTCSPYLSDDAPYYKSQSNIQFKQIDQAHICVPPLHPEGNYLENACASSKVRSVSLFREEKRSVIFPPSESFGSNTPSKQSCPKASCGELNLSGNEDYLDVRMSRWTACLHPASLSNMEEVFESHPGPPDLIIKEEHKSSKCSSNSEHEDKSDTLCTLSTMELKLDGEHSLQNDSEGYLCSTKDLFPKHKECQQYRGKSEIPEIDCNNTTKPAGVCSNTTGCESVVNACFLDPKYRSGDEEIVKQIVSESNVPSPEVQYDCLPNLRNSETYMIKFASPISGLSKNFGAPNQTENQLISVYDQSETGFNAQYNENCTPIYQTEFATKLQDIRHELQEANRPKDSSGLNSAQIECTEMPKGLLLEGLSKTEVPGTNCHVNVKVEFKKGCATSSHSPSEMKLVSDFGDGEIFGSVHSGHQQCSNNGNVDHRRGKQKHFRRANRRVPSTSSTESMLDSSPEEKVVCRVYPGRMQNRPEAQTRHKHDVPVSSCRTCSGFTKDHPMTTSINKNVDEFDCKMINGGNRTPREPNSNLNPEKTPTMGRVRKKTNICGDHSACAVISSEVGSHETLKPCLKQHEKSVAKLGNVLSQQENQALPKKDAGMHFASSDINPFLHSWQEPEPSKGTYKNQIFGSATDISCKLPQPHDHSNAVARCHSADNGLNNENSPFYSHLSTYANKRELSSSFEDFKERDSMECRLQSCHYTSNPDCAQDPRTCDSFRNVASGDLSNSSGQVDEIMLVYSSEQESIACPRKDHVMLTRDQSTQTLIVEGRQRRKNRHKRSSTQEPMTRMDTMETGAPTMWASLQNMSLYLSELIHNTSDLLGDIRCVRAKESFPETDCYSNGMARLHSFGSGKRDCSTQTAVDIGLQTREFPLLESYKEMNDRQVLEKAKPHEVNVIVKVIGSDVQDISQNLEDITLKVRGSVKDGSAAEKMKSMPDLHHENSGAAGQAHISTDAAPQKVWVSKPSGVTNLKSYNRCNSDSPLEVFPRYAPEMVSSNSSNTASLEKQDCLRGGSCCLSGHQKMCPKQVCFIDRACSPILTLEPAIGSPMGRSKSTQCLVDQQKIEMNKSFLEQHNVQSAPWISLNHKAKPGFSSNHANKEQQGMKTLDGSSKLVGLTSNRLISSFSPENIEVVSQCHSDVVEGYFMNLVSNKGSGDSKVSRNVTAGTKQQTIKEVPVYKPSSDQNLKRVILSPYLSDGAPIHSHVSSVNSGKQDECVILDCRQEFSSERTSQLLSPLDDQLSYFAANLENRQRIFEDGGESWSGPSEPSNMSEDTIQLQEDDTMSLAPSECNTDILININPLLNANQKEHRRVPEDLPMHNKFTNWSGVSDQPPSVASSSMARSASKCYDSVKQKSSCVNPSGTESQRSGLGAEMITPRRRRAKEIEMLRKDREQVMAAIRLDMNPHQLTVELTEAKLHYGLGETDAMLKLLKTTSKEEPPGFPTKQQLYNRHRRSIEGLRQEREVRLQNCRRARSLSPGKQPSSPRQRAEPPTRAPELPSRRREYLQHLRQEVVEGTRMQEPPKQAGQCPSEIELMLRDYGRAREEARMEIARARDRLRERTEQEKRRLQQRALSRAMKNDLRVRTRVSSSTLCTGSSLSLSSGPTSGYNSSNTAPLKQGVNSAQTLQVPGSPHDGGLKVRGCPPIRPWLSVQDLCLEVPVSGSNSQLPSPCGHRRTLSTNLSSSLSTCFQDIAKYTYECAVTEVRSAAAGDLGNLLEGKAHGGWKYQGTERGVQAFYKPSSSPTVHGFLGVMEVERPLLSLWCMIRDHSKAHLYNESVRSALTRPLDASTQLVYLLTDASTCHLSQPRDFCCISTESKQQGEWVLAMRSVFEESLPRPSAEAVRGELLPSAWVLQPTLCHGREVVRVTYLLQVDLGTPALPQRLLSIVAKKQAAIIAELDSFLSL